MKPSDQSASIIHRRDPFLSSAPPFSRRFPRSAPTARLWSVPIIWTQQSIIGHRDRSRAASLAAGSLLSPIGSFSAGAIAALCAEAVGICEVRSRQLDGTKKRKRGRAFGGKCNEWWRRQGMISRTTIQLWWIASAHKGCSSPSYMIPLPRLGLQRSIMDCRMIVIEVWR